MCEHLALCLVEDFVAARAEGRAPPGGSLDWDALPHAALRQRCATASAPPPGPQPGDRVPAPLLARSWADPARWRLTF
eukprot:4239494-Alexandrium_andersonii.AAC.1